MKMKVYHCPEEMFSDVGFKFSNEELVEFIKKNHDEYILVAEVDAEDLEKAYRKKLQ